MVRQHARAAGARQRRALGRIVQHAQDGRAVSVGVSAGQQVLARHRVDAARGDAGCVTTGTPIAMASRILFCVPRAMRSGATVSAARVT